MPKYKYNIQPNDPHRLRTVRGAYLQNLVDCLHACILRRDIERAQRAWAILVRCPDVNWRDRWNWGVFLLSAADNKNSHGEQGASQHAPQYSQNQRGADVDRFLRGLQVSRPEAEKPEILSERVLNLIAVGRYRAALDELETYLPAYPYTLAAPLYTYAGLICFYLAQPESTRKEPTQERDAREGTVDSTATGSTDTTSSSGLTAVPPVNLNLVRQARSWFVRALEIDPKEPVSKGFVAMIDAPDRPNDSGDEMELDSDHEDDKRRAAAGSQLQFHPSSEASFHGAGSEASFVGSAGAYGSGSDGDW